MYSLIHTNILRKGMTIFAAELPDQRQEESVLGEDIVSPMATDAERGIFPVIGERVRLRETPGLKGKVRGYLNASDDAWVMISGTERLVDGIWWLEVSACSLSMEMNGWIAKQYVDLDERIDGFYEEF